VKIYCSGIGGIGLSAYAAFQNANGHDVSGSDSQPTALTEDLSGQGIDVDTNQDGSNVPEDADLFVYSEAIPEDAPERERAAEFGIEQQSYFKALGELSKDYQVIAVTGTHGKSSTVAMAAKVLIESGKDPSVVVGTKLKELDNRNWRRGESDIFLLEACEYRCSFHYLSPSIILLTGVDGDHFDAFKSIDEYQKAFIDFIKLMPKEGVVITHGSDSDCKKVIGEADRILVDADQLPLPELSIPGKHMQENAQLVVSLSEQIGVESYEAAKILKGFSGSWRRMEVKGTYGENVTVIDDYGHHPKEVQVTLEGAKEFYPGRLVCVFQPHMQSRTLDLYDDFLGAFSSADLVVLTDVYEARNEPEGKVDIEKFASDIEEGSRVTVKYTGNLDDTEKVLRDEVIQQGDTVICMGAGTITNMATALVS